jgi:hypothetical protein
MKNWFKIALPLGIAGVLLAVITVGVGAPDSDAARGGKGKGSEGQSVVLTGQFLDTDAVVNIGYDRADWHFEGKWSGRDLAIQQDCDDGFHRVWRFLHEDGPKGRDGRMSLPFPETATSCEGVVVDLDSADLTGASLTEGSNLTEVSNHVMIVN